MKKMLNFKYVIVGFLLVLCGACSDFLDLEPKNKIPGESVLSDPNGIKSFLADLYYGSPIEDFVYMPAAGFNARGNTGSLTLAQYALEAIHSEWPNWNQFANDWWNKGYFLNRNINLLMTYIPNLDISVEEKDALMGEAHFLRAYTYFGLAKRYGGVSIITKYQEFEPNTDNLKVPRSTEKETWDFVMEECDRAIRLLPETRNNPSEEKRRATKWTAYALKSRAALHAASVAKYWDKAPLEGEAVVEKGETDGNLLDMAKKGLNDLRKRAAHTTEVDLTLDNVLRERRIELAFENKGYWDLIRRRDFHSEFDNRRKMALVPMIDLRGEKPQYIFVRKFVPGANSCTFQTHHYYRHIPGTSTNGLTQNPKH